MHFSLPIEPMGRWFRGWYGYFRTGVAVEGRAWLCDHDHAPVYLDGQPSRPELQHVDVDLRFWNRRNGRVTASAGSASSEELRDRPGGFGYARRRSSRLRPAAQCRLSRTTPRRCTLSL